MTNTVPPTTIRLCRDPGQPCLAREVTAARKVLCGPAVDPTGARAARRSRAGAGQAFGTDHALTVRTDTGAVDARSVLIPLRLTHRPQAREAGCCSAVSIRIHRASGPAGRPCPPTPRMSTMDMKGRRSRRSLPANSVPVPTVVVGASTPRSTCSVPNAICPRGTWRTGATGPRPAFCTCSDGTPERASAATGCGRDCSPAPRSSKGTGPHPRGRRGRFARPSHFSGAFPRDVRTPPQPSARHPDDGVRRRRRIAVGPTAHRSEVRDPR